jgi:hypothetical protein
MLGPVLQWPGNKEKASPVSPEPAFLLMASNPGQAAPGGAAQPALAAAFWAFRSDFCTQRSFTLALQ